MLQSIERNRIWWETLTLAVMLPGVAGAVNASGMIALFALLSIHSEKHWRFQPQELEATLCFAMGLQNAMVTRLSGAIVRTTHLTGITTDIGIKVVRLLYAYSDRARGLPVRAAPDMQRFKLLVTIWLSFLSGATVGPALYLLIGSPAMLLPVVILLGLAAFDALLGLGKLFSPPPHVQVSRPPPSTD